MENLLMLTLEPLRSVYSRFASIIPNLLAMLVIAIVGFVAAAVARAVVHLLLTAAGFERWSDRSGFAALLKKADVWASPAQAVALSVYWVVLLGAFLAALTALNATLVDSVLAGILGYLPRLMSAVLILVVGSVAAGLISRAVLISLVNSGFGSARHYARAVRILLFVILVAMALEQLMIAPGIVVSAFSIVFGGIVLALAIAVGIAGVDIIKKTITREAGEHEPGVHANDPYS